MKTSRIASGLLLAAFLLLCAGAPASAAEAPLVPPGNSAVNQYTESFPTAGGDRDAYDRDRDRSPKKILGDKNAKKLQERGPAGRAAAELAAETAPSAVGIEVEEVEIEPVGTPASPSDGGDAGGIARGNGGGGSSGGATQQTPAIPAAAIAEAEGSSGLGTVLAKATGSSSADGMGLFLPLLILATIIWAGAYLARQHGRSVSA